MSEKLLGISSGPHVRHQKTTTEVMLEVILALMPVTVMGIVHFGLNAFLVVISAVVSAVVGEYIFDRIVKKKNTTRDLSATVTGLLLALCLSPEVPLYIPVLGSLFAVIVVKGLFGGLGKNFMNPALAARCFLLISFGKTMTTYVVDAVSSATPLALYRDGQVDLFRVFMGSTTGVIGCSAFGILVGGLFLLAWRGIRWEIPVSMILSFVVFVGIFGKDGFAPDILLLQLSAGGVLMAAFFMATDPVTSPVGRTGQLVFGAAAGLLSGLFRVFGSSADSVSYAVIIANMLTPLIDEIFVPKPFAYRKQRSVDAPKAKGGFPFPALKLLVITALCGVALSGVFFVTKDRIEDVKAEKERQSYLAVLPGAESFAETDELKKLVESYVPDESLGRVSVDKAVEAKDSSGNVVGKVVMVSTADGYDGNISISVGTDNEGKITGIAYTHIAETAGMGMRATEEGFKDQFKGKGEKALVLDKTGTNDSPNAIDALSGASVTSQAVVNAVNTAIDFISGS